jgi:uncharacterized protein
MIYQKKFIGRNNELNQMAQLLDKKSASLVTLSGRRRVGKSRLAEEFAKNHTYYEFSGLPPTSSTSPQDQKDTFMLQLAQQTNLPKVATQEWSEAFHWLAEKTKKGRIIILLDEISWMAQGDSNFLGKLKSAWDLHFKKNPKLIVILCGSVSSWIEKNIISSTGFLGRVSLNIALPPLTLNESLQLLENLGFKRSAIEKLMILAITGGIPWYIEQVKPKLSALENIKQLCFLPKSLLAEEFKHVFHDLFGRRSKIFSKIVEIIAAKTCSFQEIVTKTQYADSGSLTEYLKDLSISGYLKSTLSWSIKSQNFTQRKNYRLTDNYLRFYFKYIKAKQEQINEGLLEDMSVDTLPNFMPFIGLQFENLILNNTKAIISALEIPAEQVLYCNSFIQRKTKIQNGCQIDLMIQTKYKTIFLCEIKFSENEVSQKVISDMQRKMAALKTPRGYAYLPVLIHTGALNEKIIDAEFFEKIINIEEMIA